MRPITDAAACAGGSVCRPAVMPADFIESCNPTVLKRAPSGPKWIHEIKHDGYQERPLARSGGVNCTSTRNKCGRRFPKAICSSVLDVATSVSSRRASGRPQGSVMTPKEFEAAFPKVMDWIQQTLSAHKAAARPLMSKNFKRLPLYFKVCSC